MPLLNLRVDRAPKPCSNYSGTYVTKDAHPFLKKGRAQDRHHTLALEVEDKLAHQDGTKKGILLELKETTGGEFGVYRASIRYIETFFKAPITVTTHLKMS